MLYIVCSVFISFLLLQFKLILKFKRQCEKNQSFVANISHDLKTPVRAQINILNLLMKGRFGELTSQQYEMVKLTSVSSQYMSNLANTILADYQCEHCNLVLHKSEFDLIEMISDLCTEIGYIASDKGQNIIFNHRYPRCIIFADKLQLKRVVNNFLSNAVNYGFKNSNIIIELKQTNRRIDLCVKDKSYPLCSKDLKNIFKKFTKSEISKYNHESTGLGLYISKKIIDMHNGRIYAKNLPDGTIVFGFNMKIESNINFHANIPVECLQEMKSLKS